jgi:hypothetical protein
MNTDYFLSVFIRVICGSKRKLRLHLKHPRRVDVCKRRDRISRRSHTSYKLPKRRRRSQGIAVRRHTSTEEVSVIEKVETLKPEQDTHALIQTETFLHKRRNVRRRRAAEG